MGGVDGNLDGNGPTSELLAVQGGDGLLLVRLGANINEAIALALPGLTPAPAHDASVNNFDSGVSEESCKSSVINSEAEVGDEEHVLGRLASGILASRTSGAGSSGLADARGLLGGLSAFGDGSSFGRSFSLDGRGSNSLLLALSL